MQSVRAGMERYVLYQLMKIEPSSFSEAMFWWNETKKWAAHFSHVPKTENSAQVVFPGPVLYFYAGCSTT